MSHIQDAKNAMQRIAAKAQEVVADEKLSVAEKKTALEALQAESAQHAETISLHEQAARLMVGGESAPEAKGTEPEKAERKSIGRQIMDTDAFKSAKAAAAGSRFSFSADLKAAVTVDEGVAIANGQLNGAGGVLSLPDYLPGIVDIRYAPLRVAQLFAQGSTTSPIVSYVKEASATLGVKATAEKTLKGQSDSTFARVNEQVGKVAGFMKISDEMLQDSSQIESFLTNRLVQEVLREEENEVLNGTGYPALAGVLGRAGLQTASVGTAGTATDPSAVANAIFQMVTTIRTTAFVEPDAIVINPADWQKIRLAQDKNGQYYAGGPFTGAYGNGGYSNVDALWGFRVVQSPRIAAGTVLIGGFAECAQLFRRQGVTVEMTNSNDTDFVNNLITVRAESRSALVVYRPGGFGKQTVIWS